jgi:hypothetical protein
VQGKHAVPLAIPHIPADPKESTSAEGGLRPTSDMVGALVRPDLTSERSGKHQAKFGALPLSAAYPP